jgi:hypothetical protein
VFVKLIIQIKEIPSAFLPSAAQAQKLHLMSLRSKVAVFRLRFLSSSPKKNAPPEDGAR